MNDPQHTEPGPLVINWWTDATGIDVYGQQDEHELDTLIRELKGLCEIISEATIEPPK